MLLRIGGQDFLSALEASQPSPSLLAVAGIRMARTPGRSARPQSVSADTSAPGPHQKGETDEP